MIEQIATVVAVKGDSAWVETQRQSACGACSMNKGCGAGLFAKAFGFDSPQLKVTHIQGVEVGDHVVVGIDEQALVRGSFAAYMMPILFTFLFYRMPSGLVVYWIVNTVMSIGQQYYINKGADKADREKAALEEKNNKRTKPNRTKTKAKGR